MAKKRRPCEHIETEMAQAPRLFARVDAELRKLVKNVANEAGLKQDAWVLEAIMEKLERANHGVGQWGPLAGLSREDRARVERFVKFLKESPEYVKAASDDMVLVLMRLLKRLRKPS